MFVPSLPFTWYYFIRFLILRRECQLTDSEAVIWRVVGPTACAICGWRLCENLFLPRKREIMSTIGMKTYPSLEPGKWHRYRIRHPSSTLQLHSTFSMWIYFLVLLPNQIYHKNYRYLLPYFHCFEICLFKWKINYVILCLSERDYVCLNHFNFNVLEQQTPNV